MERHYASRHPERDVPETTTRPFFGDPMGYDDFFSPRRGINPDYGTSDKTADDKSDAPAKPLSDEKREALLKELASLYDLFNKKVVGDKDFDDIITEVKWKEKKDAEKVITDRNKEALAAYNAAVTQNFISPNPVDKIRKPIPEPVNVYTTCIDTQRILLEKALSATGLNVKKVMQYDDQGNLLKDKPKARTYAYASLGEKQAKELGAWNPGSVNMKERPKKGDILVLAKRGKEVDKAASDKQSLETIIQRSEEMDTVQANFLAKAEEAKEALKNLTDKEAISKAKALVTAANNLYANAHEKAVKAAKEAKSARAALPMTDKKLEKARSQANHVRFEFSHVGFFISLTVNKDGIETWKTFDGGQTQESHGEMKNGAKYSERLYRPDLNEISGEITQGGDDRWFQGWVSLDKIVEEKP